MHGLAITARCDVANDKYPVLNYLPVVKLIDWLHCDGIEILLGNALKSSRGNFEGTLKQAGVAVSVLASVSRQDVVTSFFDCAGESKARRKLSGTAHEQADRLDRLEAVDLDDLDNRNWFLSAYKKEVETIVKSLITNNLPSFYYLPSVTDDNENDGYVVLLRESAFLPRKIAKNIARGVDKPTSAGSELGVYLSFECDDFAMPVGKMPSPNIEHVLQTFSYMFGRIGLEDYDDEFISNVCTRTLMIVEGV